VVLLLAFFLAPLSTLGLAAALRLQLGQTDQWVLTQA
jgi:hypothetical protein